MKYKLKITPCAHEDIKSIYNYVKKDGTSVAKKQIENIYASLEKLGDFPEIGKKLENFIIDETDYLFIIIKKVYIAFYRIAENDVIIVRILSTRQDYLKILNLE